MDGTEDTQVRSAGSTSWLARSVGAALPWAVMRRIDRYVWGELWPPFGLALLAFLVFIGLELVLSLSDVMLARGVGAGTMLTLVVYKLPSLLTFAIPAGVLLAVFLSLGRLAADRELLAFQTVGYSLRRTLVPIVWFGILASAVSFLTAEFVVPSAEEAYRRELLNVLYRGEVPTLQEHVFFRGHEGELYYVQHYDGDRARGIVVYDLTGRIFPPEGRFPAVATAAEGRFEMGELLLSEGRLLRFAADGVLEEVLQFETLRLEVGEDVHSAVLGGKTPSEMSLRELSARIDLLTRSGLDARHLVVEYHSKIAVAAAAAVFALFGAPLGALLGKRGRAAGAIAGFVIVGAAQALFLWSRTMARRGMLPASLGAWLPHILLVGFGVWAFLSIDRWRLRGVLGAILIGTVGFGAPLPFTELTAERLVVGDDATSLEGWHVAASLEGYEIEAEWLLAEEGPEGWNVEAYEARLAGTGMDLAAARIVARFDRAGMLESAVAEGLSGRSAFAGPEKEEVLVYRAAWGRASFSEGEVTRLEARDAQFTTCPCLDTPPYSVAAGRFVLLPERWLYAERVRMEAFGVPTGWLPVYAARLGEDAAPLFPEIGRLEGDWFLRWKIPWALQEELWGALGLTWLPVRGDLRPTLELLWERGDLFLDPGRVRLRAAWDTPWGTWRSVLDVQDGRMEASARGPLGAWDGSVLWGRVERDGIVFERLPELSLSSRGTDWLGGTLTASLRHGRYREDVLESWRSGLSLSWATDLTVGTTRLRVPCSLALDLYDGTERLVGGLTPSWQLGALTLGYQGRWGLGRTPFGFDAQPPRSTVTWSVRGEADGWKQTFSGGWDLADGRALAARWQLGVEAVSVSLTFLPIPLSPQRFSWKVERTWDAGRLTLDGGAGLDPLTWEDVILRGQLQLPRGELTGGFRLGLDPLVLTRLSGEFTWESDRWALHLWAEFDGALGVARQLGVRLLRIWQGCLRTGLEVDLRGLRLTVEVPAFREARVRFSPLDEGLRFGG